MAKEALCDGETTEENLMKNGPGWLISSSFCSIAGFHNYLNDYLTCLEIQIWIPKAAKEV
jgi:hypothetical protein